MPRWAQYCVTHTIPTPAPFLTTAPNGFLARGKRSDRCGPSCSRGKSKCRLEPSYKLAIPESCAGESAKSTRLQGCCSGRHPIKLGHPLLLSLSHEQQLEVGNALLVLLSILSRSPYDMTFCQARFNVALKSTKSSNDVHAPEHRSVPTHVRHAGCVSEGRPRTSRSLLAPGPNRMPVNVSLYGDVAACNPDRCRRAPVTYPGVRLEGPSKEESGR